MNKFLDMAWFALIISAVLGLMYRQTVKERIKYAIYSFVAFMVISIAIAWVMYPFSR